MLGCLCRPCRVGICRRLGRRLGYILRLGKGHSARQRLGRNSDQKVALLDHELGNDEGAVHVKVGMGRAGQASGSLSIRNAAQEGSGAASGTQEAGHASTDGTASSSKDTSSSQGEVAGEVVDDNYHVKYEAPSTPGVGGDGDASAAAGGVE